MQEFYQPVEWVAEQTMNERVRVRSLHPTRPRRGRRAVAGGLRRLAAAIDG